MLDVSGQRVNTLLEPGAAFPIAINGGRIELIAPGYAAYNTTTPNVDVGVVTLAEGSFLNATGGAHTSRPKAS